MDQIKIGKFISERRKKVNLTQMQLAEQLNVTDRAVSKWETGKSLPDSSIMLQLCGILGITVNDLLSGEVVTMEHYNNDTEKHLLELMKQKEEADSRLFSAEVFIGLSATATLFALVLIAKFVEMSTGLRITLIVLGFALFLPCVFYALRIEQIAGYYACKKCGHKYVPTFKAVSMAPHLGRSRYMRCPHCEKKAWHKKIHRINEE